MVMDKGRYYDEMRQLAREKRTEHGLTTATIGLATIRAVYKREGIRLDLWDGPLKKVKAAYFWEDGDASVMVRRSLPEEPRLFAQVHELKHHWADQHHLVLHCADVTDRSPVIEIAAEEFAAEFIYPADEFAALVASEGLARGSCSPEQIVLLKSKCGAKVSYQFIRKRLERLGVIDKGQFARIQFRNLQDQVLGKPFYRRNARRLRIANGAGKVNDGHKS